VSSVFPGETIRYTFWREGEKIIFSGSTVERGKEVIVGVIELAPAPKL